MTRDSSAPAHPGTAVGARNLVKEAAATGQRIRGVHITFAAPSVIEVLASTNLQFVDMRRSIVSDETSARLPRGDGARLNRPMG